MTQFLSRKFLQECKHIFNVRVHDLDRIHLDKKQFFITIQDKLLW